MKQDKRIITSPATIYCDGSICIKTEVHTEEDWYPTVDGKLTLTLYLNRTQSGIIWHRVCVWGGDDTGMEMDFHMSANVDAVIMFHKVKSLKLVTRFDLKQLGFTNA